MNATRLVIVADDPLARAGLAALLSDHVAERDDCLIAGQLAAPQLTAPQTADQPGQDFARDLAVYRPDVLLWDVGWEADNDSLPDFRDFDQPVIALAADDSLAAAIRAAGARGVLRRDAAPERVIAAVGAVIAGLIVLDPAFAAVRQPTDGAAPDFTPRELDVLRLLAEGLANRAIAQQLAISEHTVKFHLNAILGKLVAQSRTEAVVSAIRLGVIAI